MIDGISAAVRGMRVQEADVEASARRLTRTGSGTATVVNPGGNAAAAAVNSTDVGPACAAQFLPDVDVGREMVNLKMAEKIYEANAKVIEIAGKMLEKTVDVKA
ncbi:MAG: flagellar basal body rod C-terminal domain-containing protein [Syntrophobacteraceae bacterium]|nr:hypothetical protein [Desulfobacteraceae bacterium]